MRVGLVWAAWTAEAVLVQRRSAPSGGAGAADRVPEIERVARRTPASLRYFVRLYRRATELLLRCGDGAGTSLDVAAAGGHFQAPAAPLPPEIASLAPYRVSPLGGDGIAALPDERRLLLWRPGGPVAGHALPSGFGARAVAEDEHQQIYVAGSVEGGRLRSASRRHAFAVSGDRGGSWQLDERAHGGLVTALRSLLQGAEGEYRTVTAAGDWLVLTAEAGELGEESTFVFVRDGRGRWSSELIAADVFRAAMSVGDGAVQIVSHRANAIIVDQDGRARRSDLRSRIGQVLGGVESPPPADARFEILGADARDGAVALLVSIRVPSAAGLARYGEAIVLVGAGGDQVVHVQYAPDPELVTVCVDAAA